MKPYEVEVGGTYGAPMGRPSGSVADPSDLPPKSINVDRVSLYDGDYDKGGAYWGSGILYCAWSEEDDYCQWIKTKDRNKAIALLEIPADRLTDDNSYIIDEVWQGFYTAILFDLLHEQLENIEDGDEEARPDVTFAPSTTDYLRRICTLFSIHFQEFLMDASEHLLKTPRECTAIEYAGQDLWMTITESGVGFGDGDWDDDSEIVKFCDKISKPELYLGDDGLVYVSGKENYGT